MACMDGQGHQWLVWMDREISGLNVQKRTFGGLYVQTGMSVASELRTKIKITWLIIDKVI